MTVGYDELQGITSEIAQHVDRVGTFEEFMAADREAMRAAGLDMVGVTKFCQEQAADDMRKGAVLLRLPGELGFIALLATAYDVGIRLGWKLHEKYG